MKILSAGQTSSERAALTVARELGLPCGGRCREPKDYLREVERNAREADGTLVLTRKRAPRDSLTMKAIFKSPKRGMWADMEGAEDLRKWIRTHRIGILHVTGHVPYAQATEFLHAVLRNKAGV